MTLRLRVFLGIMLPSISCNAGQRGFVHATGAAHYSDTGRIILLNLDIDFAVVQLAIADFLAELLAGALV